ncbi:MAG: methyl-accepting chemotaxis protein [Xenococcaceae cyanobacterium MO_188.B29]|nr:methyl-accepting chemotaxis protein [Xenococcaceae cyanobacterium MO_188.B29]
MTLTPSPLDSQKKDLSSSPNSHTRKLTHAQYSTYRSPSLRKSRQTSLQIKLLSIVLPVILGTLALSSFLGYRLIHKTAEEEIEQQLENQAILAKDTIEQLLDKAIKIPQVVASNPQIISSIRNPGSKNSQIVQIISPELNNGINIVTSEELSQEQEILGGDDLARIASLILQKQNNLKELETKLKQEFSVQHLKINADSAQQIIVSFAYKNKYYKLIPFQEQDWVAVASMDDEDLGTVGNELTSVLIVNVLVVGLIATIIISLLSRPLSQPLVNLATTAEQAAAGNLDVQAQFKGTVEVQTLAYGLNNLIVQVKELLEQEQIKAEEAKNLQRIIQSINEKEDKNEILATAVAEIKQILRVDRVIYYQFDQNWQGTVTAESVVVDYPSTLGTEINDPYFSQPYAQKYEQGQIAAIDNWEEVELTDSHRQQLESLAIKANVMTPVLLQGKLDGFLIVHQCSSPRHWQTSEIDFVIQIANQISSAFARLSFLEQLKVEEEKEKQAREHLQQRALQLLMEVDPVSRGDLTIRAQVQEDEIGTIADSYNATIENLHKIVNQVKAVSLEVQANTSENEQVISNLAQEAVKQAEEISLSMIQIQKMSESIKGISANAAQAKSAVQNANQNIAAGDEAMNRTVTEINAIQTTVNQAAQKVKQLGESSRTISQAVNLIGRFAAQTHLLALKASIEAARAGEQGKGFAVIADEVRSLAAQSAEATTEIDNLVTRIQLETNEVVEAMNRGTQQVEVGTQLVQQTRQSLTEINAASHEISQLVGAIAQAAIAQAETSGLVSTTIADVAIIAEENSKSATQVSTSIKELRRTAEKLQAGIGQFKT